jgi:hypothetical protein
MVNKVVKSMIRHRSSESESPLEADERIKVMLDDDIPPFFYLHSKQFSYDADSDNLTVA